MATYKVLQDIEAEDKFLGPLTLKQFIFGSVTIVCLYLSFLFLTKGLWPLVLFLAPIAFVTGFLAFPWGRDQPTETWLLAKLRFYFKPRRRIWDQSGILELVKITVPKKVQLYTGSSLTQNEVESRLQALAATVDTRGWAIKNVSKNIYENPVMDISIGEPSDRLADPTILPSLSDRLDANDGIDIFDAAKTNAVDAQLQKTLVEHKNKIKKQTTHNEPNVGNWFMQEKEDIPLGYTTFSTAPLVTGSDSSLLSQQFSHQNGSKTKDEEQFLEDVHTKKLLNKQSFHNHKTIIPDSEKLTPVSASTQVTPPSNPATIELARNNDRNITSIAREINQIQGNSDQEEVIVSLH